MNIPCRLGAMVVEVPFCDRQNPLVVGTAIVGKSLLAAGAFASGVSLGAAWPDGQRVPRAT